MFKNLLTLFSVSLVLLLLTESAARIYQYKVRNQTILDSVFSPIYRHYFFLGESFKPNSSGKWESISRIKINNLGFRGPDVDIENKAGNYRIVTFGGSTSHAGNYPRKLEKILNDKRNSEQSKIEVINAAVPAWNSTQSLVQYLTRAIYLKPDMIIIYHGINDRANSDYKWLEAMPEVDYQKYANPLKWHLVSYNFLANRVRRFLKSSEVNAKADKAIKNQLINPKISDKIFKQNISNFISVAKQQNTRVVLVTMSLNYDPNDSEELKLKRAGLVYAKYPESVTAVNKFNDILRTLARSNDVILVDAAAEQSLTEAKYFVDLCHWNDLGAEQFAQFLAGSLQVEL